MASTLVAVSRLRWFDLDAHATVEIPHVRGLPVDSAVDVPAERVREWPNRLGHIEPASEGDRIHWYPELAARPPLEAIAFDLGGQPCDEGAPVSTDESIEERTRWLGSLIRSISQVRGVRAAAPVAGPCGIVLTPTGLPPTFDVAQWGSALAPIPRRLGEFPGGIQLAVTPTVWSRREAYAEAVNAIIRTGEAG